METRLTKCYAIWIRTKKEGAPLFFGGGNDYKACWGIFLELNIIKKFYKIQLV